MGGQVSVSENLSVFIPEIVMLVMFSVVLPVFVSVIDVVSVLLNFTRPKFMMFGISCTVPVASVIVALADLVVSLTEVAVSVTVGLVGIVAGGV
jgi:hypothetical protein